MITNSLWNPWRSRVAASAARPARPRRAWHLDLGRAAPVEQPVDEDDDEGDGSWFASSHELAQGLLVTEHHASLDDLARRAR